MGKAALDRVAVNKESLNGKGKCENAKKNTHTVCWQNELYKVYNQ